MDKSFYDSFEFYPLSRTDLQKFIFSNFLKLFPFPFIFFHAILIVHLGPFIKYMKEASLSLMPGIATKLVMIDFLT